MEHQKIMNLLNEGILDLWQENVLLSMTSQTQIVM